MLYEQMKRNYGIADVVVDGSGEGNEDGIAPVAM